ncbi:MAG: hypothetical protein GEU90_10490 [Gemmatimonas sp.]|nr:hypothetical protein [Gemmatimonas sp.]
MARSRLRPYHPARAWYPEPDSTTMTTHLFIVHFPVSLILAGVIIDLVGAAVGDSSARGWAGRLLIAGGFFAFLAFGTGEGAKFAALASQELDAQLLTRHEEWGSIGAWALLILAFLRAIWRNRFDGAHGWLNAGIGVVGAALVVVITLSGTLVRHGP